MLRLKNWKLNVVGDSEYNDYVVISLDETPENNLVDLDILFTYTSSTPNFYFDYGIFGEHPVFHGSTDAFSLTAGTKRVVHMRNIGDDDWIVTYHDLQSWNPPVYSPLEEEP